MKILFDQGTPVPLRTLLADHVVETAFESGWSELSNGGLLSAAQASAFDLLLTTDRSLLYQQDISAYRLAILVLPTTRWPDIRRHVDEIVEALDLIQPGEYELLKW